MVFLAQIRAIHLTFKAEFDKLLLFRNSVNIFDILIKKVMFFGTFIEGVTNIVICFPNWDYSSGCGETCPNACSNCALTNADSKNCYTR